MRLSASTGCNANPVLDEGSREVGCWRQLPTTFSTTFGTVAKQPAAAAATALASGRGGVLLVGARMPDL
jgi:hypothetical protein